MSARRDYSEAGIDPSRPGAVGYQHRRARLGKRRRGLPTARFRHGRARSAHAKAASANRAASVRRSPSLRAAHDANGFGQRSARSGIKGIGPEPESGG
jgi:hypothetical protein